MTTPRPTLYGGTLTTTFTTTLTFTPDQESITILYPWPPITSPVQYTTPVATSPEDKEFPSGLPILVLTDVVGIMEDTTGRIVKTATLVQAAPSVGVVRGAGASGGCLEWRCWSEEKRIGILVAIGLLVIGILGMIWWALCCRRKKERNVRRKGDVESGKRRRSRNSRRHRERRRRRDSVSSVERRRGEGIMRLSSDNSLADLNHGQAPPVIQRQESRVSRKRRRVSVSGVPEDLRSLSTHRTYSRPPRPPDLSTVPLQMPPFPPSRSRSISKPRRNSRPEPPPEQYTAPRQMPPPPRSRISAPREPQPEEKRVSEKETCYPTTDVSPEREEKSKAAGWIPWATLLTLGLKLLHDIVEPNGALESPMSAIPLHEELMVKMPHSLIHDDVLQARDRVITRAQVLGMGKEMQSQHGGAGEQTTSAIIFHKSKRQQTLSVDDCRVVKWPKVITRMPAPSYGSFSTPEYQPYDALSSITAGYYPVTAIPTHSVIPTSHVGNEYIPSADNLPTEDSSLEQALSPSTDVVCTANSSSSQAAAIIALGIVCGLLLIGLGLALIVLIGRRSRKKSRGVVEPESFGVERDSRHSSKRGSRCSRLATYHGTDRSEATESHISRPRIFRRSGVRERTGRRGHSTGRGYPLRHVSNDGDRGIPEIPNPRRHVNHNNRDFDHDARRNTAFHHPFEQPFYQAVRGRVNPLSEMPQHPFPGETAHNEGPEYRRSDNESDRVPRRAVSQLRRQQEIPRNAGSEDRRSPNSETATPRGRRASHRIL
ncbi:hypothetical protein B7494_g3409 [Chlorociboria aeruginascens]|nr:hypothetical protein B7494_g3409 [Chlorociboria aeruginascens]